MNFVEILDTTIKNHPMIDETRTYNKEIIHFATCPCGFKTKYSRHEEKVLEDFQSHIADETNDLLVENNFLKTSENKPSRSIDKIKSRTKRTPVYVRTLY